MGTAYTTDRACLFKCRACGFQDVRHEASSRARCECGCCEWERPERPPGGTPEWRAEQAAKRSARPRGATHVCIGCGRHDTTAPSMICNSCVSRSAYPYRECRTGVKPVNPLYEDIDPDCLESWE